MHTTSITKETLESLYTSGKSIPQIAKYLNCSVHKVVYWMCEYDIKRRTHSQASYLQFNPDGDPFKIKRTLSLDETLLFGLGLGIYFGEGEKVSAQHVRVSNTDPAILRIFIKFLLDICQLERRKLSYSLICFNDSNPQEAKMYWSKELEISPDKFGKITQIPQQGKGNYKHKSVYGVCTVRVGNIKLKAWFMEQLKSARIASEGVLMQVSPPLAQKS